MDRGGKNTIERIFFPTRFRELSFNALECLLALKEAGLREVILSYIIPVEEVAFVPFGGYLKDEEEHLREEARIRFEDWQRELLKAGLESKVIIEVGDPVPKILSLAERERADLIVVGKKKKTGAEGIFIESHTMDILRRSRIPALVYKYMVQFEWDGEIVTRTNDRIFRRPLLAADWSLPSERALGLLLSLKGIVKEAVVVHILETRIKKGMEKAELLRIEKESRERLERYCAILKSAGIQAESHLSAGNGAQEIINLSREFDASMLVMGTTGKDRLHEFFMGSVSHRVAEMSELPTLLSP